MIVNNNQFRKQEFEKRRVFKKGTSLCNAYSCPIFQNCLLEIKQLQQENARLKDKIKDLEEWLEAMASMYEDEYKDVNASEHYKCILHKLKEN